MGWETIRRRRGISRVGNKIRIKRGCAARLPNLQVMEEEGHEGKKEQDGIGIIRMGRFACATALTDEARSFYSSNPGEELCTPS